MNFQPNEAQVMAVDSWRKAIVKEIVPITSQYLDRTIPALETKELLKITTQFGVGNGWVADSDGGLGLDFVTSGLLYEALAEYSADLAGICFVNEGAAVKIANAASPAIRERYLQPTLAGDLIGCSAISEPDAGSDVRAMRTTATPVDGGYRLRGDKLWISNSSVADYVVVTAATADNEFTMFLVDREEHGFDVKEVDKLGLNGWSLGEVSFSDVFVPEENRLGEVGGGLRETMKGFERSRCFISLLGLGLGQAALHAAIDYAQQRRSFGKEIGKHQLVQQLLAEMAVELEASRLMVFKGLSALDVGSGSNIEASMAKLFATEAMVRVTHKAIQVHGAFGISQEFPLERYFRSARMLTIPDGTTQINTLIVGRYLTGFSAFS